MLHSWLFGRHSQVVTLLSCDKTVYRAMLRKKWVDPVSGTVLPGAFIRRDPPQDDDGLSVDVVSPASCASPFNKCFGVGSLHVGKVRELGLDVVVDEIPHANITGVPRPTDDAARAEWFASQLARQARFIPPEHC
jgi:hypothetical protein